MTGARALAIVAALGAVAIGCHHKEEPLRIYSSIPDIHFVDQDEHAFNLDRMHGKVWIANFIYTSCPGPCPLLSRKMARMQARTNGLRELQLVSFTVDPEVDTPPTLKSYAKQYNADARRWNFVTGPPDAIIAAVGEGFKVGVTREKGAAPPDSPDGFAIVHGENFVLIDQQSRIRGYYHKDDIDQERLFADAIRLARSGGT